MLLSIQGVNVGSLEPVGTYEMNDGSAAKSDGWLTHNNAIDRQVLPTQLRHHRWRSKCLRGIRLSFFRPAREIVPVHCKPQRAQDDQDDKRDFVEVLKHAEHRTHPAVHASMRLAEKEFVHIAVRDEGQLSLPYYLAAVRLSATPENGVVACRLRLHRTRLCASALPN